jgi:hypothetical protein
MATTSARRVDGCYIIHREIKKRIMKQKKFTVNERIALLEKMCYKLALEVQAIVTAINKTVEEKKEDIK